VRLKKALYGHPDSGSFWEKHCDEHVRSVGFLPIGPERPSTYFHAKLGFYMVLYVDDFKLAEPTATLKTGWNLLRQGLTIEPEKNQALFLGCIHEVGKFKLPAG
jgi:hypothetical protein